MEISLASARRRWIFFGGVFLVAGCLTLAAGKHWLADRWAHSSNPDDWRRAAELEPDNASHWFRLAQFYESDFLRGDVEQAIRYYQQALALNPRSATYWMELAGAYELRGEPERAREAFARARASYPISAEVAWRYGNFLLRQGQLDEALAEIRRAVETNPRLAPAGILVYWRATSDPVRVLDELLPRRSRSYWQALDFFLSQQELNAALTAWQRIVSLGEPFEPARALPLLEELIRQQRVSEAQQAWDEALGAAGPATGDSLVWDGGFERDWLNGGFGWRRQEIAGGVAAFDAANGHSGQRSLRLDFDGSANLNFQHVFQYVPVEPGRRYRFSAFVRTEGISTDSGIRFRLFDLYRPAALDVATPALAGTNFWSRLTVDVTTGANTRVLVIALRRPPSQKLDNKLRGTVWVDDVSLTPVAPTRPGGGR